MRRNTNCKKALRRKVALNPPPSNAVIALYLRSSFRRAPTGPLALDTPEIVAFWELINTSLTTLLSPQGGILAELLTYWETAQNFMDGKAQATLPVGIDDQSRKHHRISEDGIKTLRAGSIELITILRDSMATFFLEPPIEDISSILSPVPDTPATPSGFVPINPIALRIPSKVPEDEFAFLPPGANSLGGAHYLGRILTLLGNAACLLAELPIGTQTQEKLKSMMVGARERCIHAVCISWLRGEYTRNHRQDIMAKFPTLNLQTRRTAKSLKIGHVPWITGM